MVRTNYTSRQKIDYAANAVKEINTTALLAKHAYPRKASRVRFLVLHYTEVDLETSLRLLTQGDVSIHYLIPETPTPNHPAVYQLVDENKTAWHAGKSHWQGYDQLNEHSIGIEIVNDGKTAFTEYQIQQVIALSQSIIARHRIKPDGVVGHSDIAPGRKCDPGPLFPWKQLAEAGVGAWATSFVNPKNAQPPSINEWQKQLSRYGYKIDMSGRLDDQTKHVISAFQQHFRPQNYSGEPDAETFGILKQLCEQFRN